MNRSKYRPRVRIGKDGYPELVGTEYRAVSIRLNIYTTERQALVAAIKMVRKDVKTRNLKLVWVEKHIGYYPLDEHADHLTVSFYGEKL